MRKEGSEAGSGEAVAPMCWHAVHASRNAETSVLLFVKRNVAAFTPQRTRKCQPAPFAAPEVLPPCRLMLPSQRVCQPEGCAAVVALVVGR